MVKYVSKLELTHINYCVTAHGELLYGVEANTLDCDIIGRKFETQFRDCIKFWTYTLMKVMKQPILPALVK